MHRVQNMGSVLQAYALQKAVENLGYEVELIDYEFPPAKQPSISLNYLVEKSYAFIVDALKGFADNKRLKLLSDFRNQFIKCSTKSYSWDSIHKTPPQYDVYCTGSDQVWNPLHVGRDTTFLLDFIPEGGSCFSYASSFATASLPELLYPVYKKELNKYCHITVREETGIRIIKELTGKDASVVCDPTLLLEIDEWKKISNESKESIQGEYILVYLLRYMFDPRPGFYTIVRKVQKELRLPVYYFDGSLSEIRQKDSKVISGKGPKDFINLVKNASFIITDSFHGTAFASLFNIPMIGVVNDTDANDSRLASLRRIIGGEQSILRISESVSFTMSKEKNIYTCDENRLRLFREKSKNQLKTMLEDCCRFSETKDCCCIK